MNCANVPNRKPGKLPAELPRSTLFNVRSPDTFEIRAKSRIEIFSISIRNGAVHGGPSQERGSAVYAISNVIP